MKQSKPCQHPGCGLVKSAGIHIDGHEYVAPPRDGFGSKGSRLNARSTQPNRVERAQEVAQARQERREAVRHCEAPDHGITTPCGTGADATLEASHVVGLGMGGGKEHHKIRMLCRRHHRELDTDRETFRAAGLSERAPRPDKVVPRPVEQSTRTRRSMFRD